VSHNIERRLTVLRNGGATVVVVCACGEKFSGRSDRDAEKAQFQHMLDKERSDEVPF
jgi:hypothetical protein